MRLDLRRWPGDEHVLQAGVGPRGRDQSYLQAHSRSAVGGRCVLPLALGGLGAGASIFAVLEAIADYRVPLLIASAVLVSIAWCVYFGRRGALAQLLRCPLRLYSSAQRQR